MPNINLNSVKDSDVQSICTKSHKEVKGFRVRVCLERFFSDERSRAYVNVIQHRPVRWLQQHLRNLFGLKGLFCLCSNGYFLPSEEPLSILQPNDPVDVIPLSKDFLNSANENSSKINLQSKESEYSHNVIDSIVISDYSAKAVDKEVTGHEEEEYTELLCMKQQALALLETCCEDTASAELDSGQTVHDIVDGDKPRRTRRRVRRRKRQLSGGDLNGGNGDKETIKGKIENIGQSAFENNVCTLPEEKTLPGDLVNMFKDVEKATVRNGLSDTRKARLVRSISPPQT